jgi:hypothetical protein
MFDNEPEVPLPDLGILPKDAAWKWLNGIILNLEAGQMPDRFEINQLKAIVRYIKKAPAPKHKARKTIKASGRFQIKGRGTVFMADAVDNPGIDLRSLMGKGVEINGEPYFVTLVECQGDRPDVGLVVRPG